MGSLWDAWADVQCPIESWKLCVSSQNFLVHKDLPWEFEDPRSPWLDWEGCREPWMCGEITCPCCPADDGPGTVLSSLNLWLVSPALCLEDAAGTLAPDWSKSLGSSNPVDIGWLLFTCLCMTQQMMPLIFWWKVVKQIVWYPAQWVTHELRKHQRKCNCPFFFVLF